MRSAIRARFLHFLVATIEIMIHTVRWIQQLGILTFNRVVIMPVRNLKQLPKLHLHFYEQNLLDKQ